MSFINDYDTPRDIEVLRPSRLFVQKVIIRGEDDSAV